MNYLWPISITAGVIVIFVLYLIFRKPKEVAEDPNALNRARDAMDEDQIALDEYSNRELSSVELGTRYERYIGHLYEMNGFEVEYHGATNELEDLGRDLIVKKGKEILIVQTKCWAKKRSIREKHIFQLYGSMVHFRRTSKAKSLTTKAVIYTSYSSYSGRAIEVSQDLGVELKTEKLDNSYPKVKCKISDNGEKAYHLPFEPGYDELSIDPSKGEFFAHSVLDAFEKGHRRPEKSESAA